jgi:hypothetical protein
MQLLTLKRLYDMTYICQDVYTNFPNFVYNDGIEK